MQGVPTRLEIGPKDMEKQVCVLARRDTGKKETVAWADVTSRVPELLEDIQVSQSMSTACMQGPANQHHAAHQLQAYLYIKLYLMLSYTRSR